MKKLKRKEYESLIKPLQLELVRFQSWLRETGQRIVIVFEGRDSAGKGGTIRAITDRVSHRTFQTVALPKPSDREKTQWYPQRYIQHFPASGGVTLFDRSWYNRAGVDKVMGFCEPERVALFLRECPAFERSVTESGIVLVKYWLEITPAEQHQRLSERMEDPRKHWKLSPMDLESHRRWYDYSRARDEMLDATDTDYAPWHIIDYRDQRRGRLNCITHLLSLFDYRPEPFDMPDLPEVDASDAYDDQAAIADRRWVEPVF